MRKKCQNHIIFNACDGICYVCIFKQYEHLPFIFYQCDCELLKKEGYNNRNDILENYFIRLRYMLIIDIVPAAVLTVVYAVAGIVSKSNAGTVIPVCVGILMLSCLFTVLQLTLYYAIQPYTKDAVKSRNRYVIINIIMYVCSSLFIYINSTALFLHWV